MVRGSGAMRESLNRGSDRLSLTRSSSRFANAAQAYLWSATSTVWQIGILQSVGDFVGEIAGSVIDMTLDYISSDSVS